MQAFNALTLLDSGARPNYEKIGNQTLPKCRQSYRCLSHNGVYEIGGANAGHLNIKMRGKQCIRV